MAYYDLGMFETFYDVTKFLDDVLEFLTTRENDVQVTTDKDYNRWVVSGYEQGEYVDVITLNKYYNRALEIFDDSIETESKARSYYTKYLGRLEDEDLYALSCGEDDDNALMTILYLLMVKDDVLKAR
jgi:hypothetical protein